MKSGEGKEAEEGGRGNKQRHRQFPQKGSWVQIICINNNLRGSQRQKYMQREREREGEEKRKSYEETKEIRTINLLPFSVSTVGCWLLVVLSLSWYVSQDAQDMFYYIFGGLPTPCLAPPRRTRAAQPIISISAFYYYTT